MPYRQPVRRPRKTRLGHGRLDEPGLEKGEHILLKDQGVYRRNTRSGWRPVQSFLTDRRFILFQRPRTVFEVALEAVRTLDMERHYCVLKIRDVLCIAFDAPASPGKGKVWFAVNNMAGWKKAIFQAALLKFDVNILQEMAAQLDADGQALLWFLWEKGHARITELARVIDAPTHMHVLLLIKETLNPIAEKVVGCPIFSFERARADPETGEKILFSWWMLGRREKLVSHEGRFIEVFDEDARIQIIMEVKGLEPGDIRLDLAGDRLTIRSHKVGVSLREIIQLSAPVTLNNHTLTLNNNLLDLRLLKAGAEDEV
ncbi:MAG: Hsp20/alpha crystallin family protein [Deltaproteobacteria bacterium]|nr:Hsp20/alpha crystallin family protein [Deltaproteobacteria bacterium]